MNWTDLIRQEVDSGYPDPPPPPKKAKDKER